MRLTGSDSRLETINNIFFVLGPISWFPEFVTVFSTWFPLFSVVPEDITGRDAVWPGPPLPLLRQLPVPPFFSPRRWSVATEWTPLPSLPRRQHFPLPGSSTRLSASLWELLSVVSPNAPVADGWRLNFALPTINIIFRRWRTTSWWEMALE